MPKTKVKHISMGKWLKAEFSDKLIFILLNKILISRSYSTIRTKICKLFIYFPFGDSDVSVSTVTFVFVLGAKQFIEVGAWDCLAPDSSAIQVLFCICDPTKKSLKRAPNSLWRNFRNIFSPFYYKFPINMLSSQLSYKQIILEMVQATDEVSILKRLNRWFLPHRYAKSLFGNSCSRMAHRKFKLLSSSRIKKVILISSVILSFSLELGLVIGAKVFEGTPKQYFLELSSFCALLTIAVYLMRFDFRPEPLEVAGSRKSLIRINKTWSRCNWFFATWPLAACLLGSSCHIVIGKLQA